MKEEQKELNCEECAYVTTDKSNLNKHIKTHQQKRPEFKCENCVLFQLPPDPLHVNQKRRKDTQLQSEKNDGNPNPSGKVKKIFSLAYC